MRTDCITIFGGTGDLTFRKLLPALYNLFAAGREETPARILIIGRRPYTDADYRAKAQEWVKKFARLPYTDETYARFAETVFYFEMDFTDAAQYAPLGRYYEREHIRDGIFYFAVAPRFFRTITEGLAGVPGARQWKVVLEKPFGEELEDARALSARLEEFFTPERVYRIDHYLGKEMVRGIQTLRFSNPIFSAAWNAGAIDCVQIVADEQVGVETRGGYYDHSGALRDMVQNHLFQILSILAMEMPDEAGPAQLHAAQLRVLRALRLPTAQEIGGALVMGQYEGYRAEPQVAADSRTETYAALRLFLDTKRWRGVPFYVRTGKRLARREMSVTIVFHAPAPGVEPCLLTLRIQPTEGVTLRFNIKKPGQSEDMMPVEMDFCQSCMDVSQQNTPEAYERLLTACVQGERSWFSQWDQIETCWRFIDGLKAAWEAAGSPIASYEAGSAGPAAADALTAQLGHAWVEAGENYA